MQKKLMAVAVAGALAAPVLAMAADSTVQIYGRMTFEYSYMDRGTGTTKGDGLQSPGGTSIGFKGEEKLGGGLSAWFQCESSAAVIDGGDGTCTRNSALGFKGGFGNFYVGRWDTPYKQAASVGDGVGSEDTGVQGNSKLMVNNSTGVTGTAPRSTWKRRQANTLNYNSPKFGGFDVRAAYSSIEATGLLAGAAKPRVMSIAGMYSGGPLSIGLGYEEHQDAGGIGLDDKGFVVSGKYKIGKLLLGGAFHKHDYDVVGGSVDRQSWTLGAEFNLSGPSNIEASFTRADDMKGTAGGTPVPGTGNALPGAGPNTGAKQYQVAYRHTFSKRTEARLAYVIVDNDSATAAYTLNGLSASPALGAKQKAISLLVKHTF